MWLLPEQNPRLAKEPFVVSSPEASAVPATNRSTVRVGRRACGALVGLVAAIVALGPALRPGYLLFYDMVFVPHLELSARTLGVDGSVPRAVPSDLMVAIASQVMPGWVVQKLLLVLIFVGVGYGVGALMTSRIGAVAAAVCATWNPYVAERLAIGHWNFLLGYAALPFLLAAASDVRQGKHSARFRLYLWTVLAAMTGSTGALIGLLVTVSVLLVPHSGIDDGAKRRRLPEVGRTVGMFVLANAVWWFPSLFLAPVTTGDRSGVAAFGPRADTPLGVFGSLVTGGGIWNAAAWTPGRASAVATVAAVILAVASVGYAFRMRFWRRSPGYAGLTVAGVASLVAVGCTGFAPGQRILEVLVGAVPGAGLLRDSQKFLAIWVLFTAVCAGLLVEGLLEVGRSVGVGRIGTLMLAGLVGLWPVVVLPGFAWGTSGRWSAVDYPASYQQMSERVAALPTGSVAVFPWTAYRRYAFDDGRVMLDPWQRLLDRTVLVSDDLPLSGGVVRGEDPRSAAVSAALRTGGDVRGALRQAGVGYVLVQADQPSTASTSLPSSVRGTVIATSENLTLVELDASAESRRPPAETPRWWSYAGLAGSVGAGALVLAMGSRAPARYRGRGGRTALSFPKRCGTDR